MSVALNISTTKNKFIFAALACSIGIAAYNHAVAPGPQIYKGTGVAIAYLLALVAGVSTLWSP